MERNIPWSFKSCGQSFKLKLLFFFFLISLFFSCADNDTKPGTDSPKDTTHVLQANASDTSNKALTSIGLDVLLLENHSGNNQLEKLKEATNKEKIIVQFLIRNNKLTVGLWPGTKKNASYDASKVQYLTNKEFSQAISDETFLGNQEIKKDDTKKLFDRVNQAAHKYIYFYPTYDGKHIKYLVISSPTEQTLTAENIKALAVLFETNPSPPKDAEIGNDVGPAGSPNPKKN